MNINQVTTPRPGAHDAQEAGRAKTSGAQAPGSGKTGAADKAGAAAPAADSVQLSDKAQGLFYRSVLKATGADQFLDWNSSKSRFANLDGVKDSSKEDVLANLRALLDAKDPSEHWDLSVVKSLIERMEAAEDGDNQYRGYTPGVLADSRAFEKSVEGFTPEAREDAWKKWNEDRPPQVSLKPDTGLYVIGEGYAPPGFGEADAKEAEEYAQARAEFFAENPDHKFTREHLDIWTVWEGPPKWALQSGGDGDKNTGIHKDLYTYTPQERKALFDSVLKQESAAGEAARERDNAEGLSAGEKYLKRLERALGRSQAFWDHDRDTRIQNVEHRSSPGYAESVKKSYGQEAPTPQQLKRELEAAAQHRRPFFQREYDRLKEAFASAALRQSIAAWIK